MVLPAAAVSISPLPGRHRRRAPRGESAINSVSEKGLLVLIEPDPSVRDALSVLLRSAGWTIRCVHDCLELRDLIEGSGDGRGAAAGIAAVISESRLPDCTPEEILQLSSAHGLPVVFTGHDLPLQAAVDLIRQGAVDFLDKPFPQSRLLDLLERFSTRQNG
jgi:two-component system response regulator FixJ